MSSFQNNIGGDEKSLSFNEDDKFESVKPPLLGPPQQQSMSLDPLLTPPPPYDLTTPWWKKHNDTSANCCMECICRTVCLPCCLGTCLWGVATTICCGLFMDTSTKNRKKMKTQPIRNKPEQPKEPCGGMGCWGMFQYLDTNLPYVSNGVMACLKHPVRRNADEIKALNWFSNCCFNCWQGFKDCCSNCWQGFKDCVDCIVCCPCRCCSWCWDSYCIRGIRDCCKNVGFYTGRFVIGCRDCVFYSCECCCVRCGCWDEPKVNDNNNGGVGNGRRHKDDYGENTMRASAPNAL